MADSLDVEDGDETYAEWNARLFSRQRVYRHWVWVEKIGSPQRVLVRSYIMHEDYQERFYPMPLLGPDERFVYESKEITPKPKPVPVFKCHG